MATAKAPPEHSTTYGPLKLCRLCDQLVRLPERAAGQSAYCPRCGNRVAGAAQRDARRPLAWALAALIMLALVFTFNFLGFSVHGVSHDMVFWDTARALAGHDYPGLAALLVATTVGLPAIYLTALVYLHIGINAGRRPPGAVAIARKLRSVEPWMMSDVFIVGLLVSLSKIMSLAHIHLALSFAAFCLYSLMLLRVLTLVDWTTLWEAIAPAPPATGLVPGASGRSQNLLACRGCDTPFVDNPGHRCPRCGRRHYSVRINRLQLTWALLVTSIILYIPANVYPVLSATQLGRAQPQTIIAGVVHLAEAGSWPIAGIIFTASIVVPISKILALGWLCLSARRASGDPWVRTRAYLIIEKIGRWSMTDVFVVAVLGALVQAGTLMSITPEPGVLAFASVVVLTMIAAQSFDTRTLWPEQSRSYRQGARGKPRKISESPWTNRHERD